MSLFHYTNVDAIRSIVANQKIWLTDIRYMNDSRELHDGIEVLSTVFSQLDIKELLDKSYINEAIEYIRESLTDTVSYGISEDPIYIFSLGNTKDRLSQWRSYGQYAIEFSECEIKRNFNSLRLCKYEISEKQNISRDNLLSSIKRMCKEMEENNGQLGIAGLDSVVGLVEIAASFKDNGFYEEQEIRIIENGYDRDIQYRPKDNILIPYIEMDLPLECIKKIHVGPMKNQELAYESICSFAQQIEKEYQNNGGDIEYWLQVEKSDIPYRN